MINRTYFYDMIRKDLFGNSLKQTAIDGCEALFLAFEAHGITDLDHMAYTFGTTYHETNVTMQPIQEMGGSSYFKRRYDIQGEHPSIAKALGNTQSGDGVRYCGRGFVQLTGRSNYGRAGRMLGADFLTSPGLVMNMNNAAQIAVIGMRDGWFTSKKFTDYDHKDGGFDFVGARRIINGSDRASIIANYSIKFRKALTLQA